MPSQEGGSRARVTEGDVMRERQRERKGFYAAGLEDRERGHKPRKADGLQNLEKAGKATLPIQSSQHLDVRTLRPRLDLEPLEL